MPLQPGQTLNERYRIVKLLGQGGFGAVYRAWDTNLRRPCAVKENLDTSPEAQRQFRREATVLANLSHPNLPRVTDHFIIEGQGQYLVMDFVDGEDLASLTQREGVIGVSQALEWISQVADALAYLHSRTPPVVHRDVKPANIRITPEGKAMLVDFGLVKFFNPSMKTTIGARAVTPGYAPPEQYGQGSTDNRSDIYALGATLYNLLSNQQPLESVRRMVGGEMKPVTMFNSQVPPHVSRVIERAMAIEPDQRYQSAKDFKVALSTPAAESVPRTMMGTVDATMVVPPPSGVQARPSVQAPSLGTDVLPVPRPEKKPRGGFAMGFGVIAVIVLCLGAALGGGWYYLNSVQTSAEETADAERQATLDARVRMTSTAQSEKTATANSYATATAGIQATAAAKAATTATAQAGAAATEMARDSYVESLIANRSLVLGPLSGSLPHDADDGLISTEQASVDVADFMVEILVYNPYSTSEGTWDYGLLFRHSGKNQQYRLVIRSDKTWALMNNTGDANGEIIQEGELRNLNITEGGSNLIQLICKGVQGFFYLNDAFVVEMDLSARTNSGDIYVASGIYLGDEITGEVTNYEQFSIWELP